MDTDGYFKEIPEDLTEEGLKQWLESYPIPLEDFGKDYINCHSMLLGYHDSHENRIMLRQSLNTMRTIILNSTGGAFDMIK